MGALFLFFQPFPKKLRIWTIRICRFDKRKSRNVVGTVEEVGSSGKRAFSTFEELREILTRIKEGDNRTAD
jgi:hypothetical protein